MLFLCSLYSLSSKDRWASVPSGALPSSGRGSSALTPHLPPPTPRFSPPLLAGSVARTEGRGAPGTSETQETGKGPLTWGCRFQSKACRLWGLLSVRGGDSPHPRLAPLALAAAAYSEFLLPYTLPILPHPPASGCLVGEALLSQQDWRLLRSTR